MRGTVAKRLRSFAKNDTNDVPDVVYTTVVTGQEYKKCKGFPVNETVRLGECTKAYYRLLKKIWRMAA